MFGIGGFELFIILLFGFLLFGPDKLPEMAKTLGAAIRKFQKAQQEMEAVIKDEVLEVNDPKAKPAPGQAAKRSANTSTESFAERKARYDRERAERQKKQREELEANRRAMKDQAAQEAKAASPDKADAADDKPAAKDAPAAAEPAPKDAPAEPKPDAADDKPAAEPAPAEAKPAPTAPAKAKPAPTAPAKAKPAPSCHPERSEAKPSEVEGSPSSPRTPAQPARPLTPDELFGTKPVGVSSPAAKPSDAEGGE